MYEISSTGWKLSSFSMACVVEHDLFPLFFVHLKQNTFEMTNGGERPASTPLHVNGLANKTREEKQSPDRYELKESESGSKPQSNAQGVQNDKTAERAWWINSFFPCFNRHISIQSCVHFYCSRLQLKAEFEIFYLAYFLFCLFFFVWLVMIFFPLLLNVLCFLLPLLGIHALSAAPQGWGLLWLRSAVSCTQVRTRVAQFPLIFQTFSMTWA